MATPDENDELEQPVPLTADEALHIITFARPAELLSILKGADFARSTSVAFSGFRVGESALRMAVVRSRLAAEAAKTPKLSERLRQIDVPDAPPSLAPPPPTSALLAPAPTGEKAAAKLRKDRDKLRAEVQELRSIIDQVEQEKAELQHELDAWKGASTSLKKAATETEARLDKLQRQSNRLQAHNAGLAAELKHSRRTVVRAAAPPGPRVPGADAAAEPSEQTNPWLQAVQRMLSRGAHLDAMEQLVDTVLAAGAADEDALWTGLEIATVRRNAARQVAILKRLATAMHQQSRLDMLTGALTQILSLSRVASDAAHELALWTDLLRTSTSEAVSAARVPLAKLQGTHPEAFAWLKAQAGRTVATDAMLLLFPEPGETPLTVPLPLPGSPPFPHSALDVVQAVLRNDAVLVDTVHSRLRNLRKAKPKAAAKIEQALRAAASQDSTLALPLLSPGRGPAVVDASNAAWYDQDQLSSGRPRVRNIANLIALLRGRGFFPIYAYGDAPLPYTVDQPDLLEQMIHEGVLQLVDSGVDADEILVREAVRLGAPLVTNDLMRDWDPAGTVHKLSFVVAYDGTVHLSE